MSAHLTREPRMVKELEWIAMAQLAVSVCSSRQHEGTRRARYSVGCPPKASPGRRAGLSTVTPYSAVMGLCVTADAPQKKEPPDHREAPTGHQPVTDCVSFRKIRCVVFHAYWTDLISSAMKKHHSTIFPMCPIRRPIRHLEAVPTYANFRQSSVMQVTFAPQKARERLVAYGRRCRLKKSTFRMIASRRETDWGWAARRN
jgi:hypothetical protein